LRLPADYEVLTSLSCYWEKPG